MTSFYTYGTKPPMVENPGIGVVRQFSNNYLLGDEDSVFITGHANIRMGQRKITPREAVQTISTGFYVEYQNVGNQPRKSDCTVFYSGHEKKILSVNTIADIGKQRIVLITVEHFDENIWRVKDSYVERK